MTEYSLLSLRPGETVEIMDFKNHHQYAIMMTRATLPAGTKLSHDMALYVAQNVNLNKVIGWMWVSVDPESKRVISGMMMKAGCKMDKWYSMDVTMEVPCTSSSTSMN